MEFGEEKRPLIGPSLGVMLHSSFKGTPLLSRQRPVGNAYVMLLAVTKSVAGVFHIT